MRRDRHWRLRMWISAAIAALNFGLGINAMVGGSPRWALVSFVCACLGCWNAGSNEVCADLFPLLDEYSKMTADLLGIREERR